MSARLIEDFGAMMSEIAAMGDYGLFVKMEDEPIWQLMLEEDDPSVMIELDAERQVAALSCDLGAATVSDVSGLDALALEYGALHHSTGGVRVAKLRSDGSYLLLADLAVAAVNRRNFLGFMRGFVEIAKGWRQIVATGLPQGGAGLGAISMDELIFKI